MRDSPRAQARRGTSSAGNGRVRRRAIRRAVVSRAEVLGRSFGTRAWHQRARNPLDPSLEKEAGGAGEYTQTELRPSAWAKDLRPGDDPLTFGDTRQRANWIVTWS